MFDGKINESHRKIRITIDSHMIPVYRNEWAMNGPNVGRFYKVWKT